MAEKRNYGQHVRLTDDDIHKDTLEHEKKKNEKKTPAANSLTTQRIKKLFRMFCLQKPCTECTDNCQHFVTCDDSCKGCILREIPWCKQDINGELLRGTELSNLCEAIWQEGILNG